MQTKFLTLAVIVAICAQSVLLNDASATSSTTTTTVNPTTKAAITTASTKTTKAAGKTTTAASKTTTPAGTTTTQSPADKLKKLIEEDFGKLSELCSNQANDCFSTNKDLKGKLTAKNGCKMADTAKKCLTTKTNKNVCTDDEFVKMKDAACFCPQITSSIVMVFILCFISKLFGQQ